MFLRAALRQVEGEFQHPVDANPAHHRFLDDHLALGACKHAPADGRIFAFGVFAHDVEVDVAGNAARKRRGDAREAA